MMLGFHVSIAGSIDQAVDRAVDLGINTFQIFTTNPRTWYSKPLNSPEVYLFKKKIRKSSINPIFSHMPYLSNLASPRNDVYNLSIKLLTMELKRCYRLGVPFLVTHIGSHLGAGKKLGFNRIVKGIDKALLDAGVDVMLLLENTAGMGNSKGSSFEDVKKIIDGVYSDELVGFCFDTCHAFAAGYDLRCKDAVEHTLTVLDSVVGLKKLKLVHLNDSANRLSSFLDRHEHIGLGEIGDEGFSAILHSEFCSYPMIMETPIDERRGNFENLMKVHSLVGR